MLPLLRELSISYSNLTELPDLNCLKESVSLLRLIHSGIRQFPPCYFNSWRRLQHLTLTGNELTEVPSIETLSSTLFGLYLSKNCINNIRGSWATAYYKKLTVMELNHNKLTKFNFTHLAPLTDQAVIHLISNEISHLYQPIRYAQSAYQIILTGNPLVCDAKLAWVATANLVITNGICSAPRCLQNVDVSRLSKYIDIGVADQQ